MKLDYYIVRVTRGNNTQEWGYGLPYKQITQAVEQHYRDGADAVEMEMITKEEFDERLPKPY